MTLSKVLIVGAGPSGLLLGLLLSRAGIPVELLEQTYELDTNPRAAHYAPPSVFELARAGVIDDVRKQGFMPDSVSWRKLDEQKTRIATIGRWARGETGVGIDENLRMVVLPLHKLGKVLEAHLKAQPCAEIRYGYKVVGIGNDGQKAWVEVETPEGKKTVSGDYVVGCDGANSKVRKCMFGEDVYPGYTWDRQIVATNTYYDFSPYDYDDSQFFIHPDLYHMVAKIQPDGLYRITYGEIGGLNTEQLRERQPKKFEEMLPGHPKPDQYRIVNFSPYKIHQRCVDHMRVGRILLAADAAHLCNPFGGMGLTGGIADVGCLYDSLYGIHTGQADDSILDIYDQVRRRIWHDIINPVSTENIKRLFDQDADEALEKDPFLKMVKQAESDPNLAAKMQGGVMSVKYDMTQHYNKKEELQKHEANGPGVESRSVEVH